MPLPENIIILFYWIAPKEAAFFTGAVMRGRDISLLCHAECGPDASEGRPEKTVQNQCENFCKNNEKYP